ncbi:Rha family transcriptional regulator [Noviherbaspirillum sp.]|uniref:Rha family transcriptional regulator n=1 Tax=Noviherbaspirillum sp. TaxID=1926288 RepID=UPI002D6118B5|nr:Rha family transcriptional regulator [Noviherbaspirillum sp.]HZW20240.1 Rha family transcriptional regulator [Noviherbaspirillum sp.]
MPAVRRHSVLDSDAFAPDQKVSSFTLTNLVHLRHGQPFTNSLVIAQVFERQHKNVLQSIDVLIADGIIGRLEFQPSSYLNKQGKRQRMIELTERAALIVLPFVGGKKAREGQARFVDAFLSIRSLTDQRNGTWTESRRQATVSFQAMMEALSVVRKEDGKLTLPHHFANESKLINFAAFGKFESVDRDGLSQADLQFLEKLETKNIFLIAKNCSYQQRKTALVAYANALRAASFSSSVRALAADEVARPPSVIGAVTTGDIVLPKWGLTATLGDTIPVAVAEVSVFSGQPIFIEAADGHDAGVGTDDERLDGYARTPIDAFNASLWDEDLGEPVDPPTKKSDKARIWAAVQTAIAEAQSNRK